LALTSYFLFLPVFDQSNKIIVIVGVTGNKACYSPCQHEQRKRELGESSVSTFEEFFKRTVGIDDGIYIIIWTANAWQMPLEQDVRKR